MTAVQEIDRFVKELGAWHLLQVLRQVVVRGGSGVCREPGDPALVVRC